MGKNNDSPEPKVIYHCVFTGETLFIGGAGEFFEGDASKKQENFYKIRKLPGDTFIFCGHE
jgi:hydroxyacylglutathione hydrolase